MTRARVGAVAAVVLVILGIAYLHDPPWAGRLTSGLMDWEVDATGTRFRWTAGRASFFVPSGATAMTVPMLAVFPGPEGRPVVVRISVDDRWLADIELRPIDQWIRPTLPLPRRPAGRRFRRVDLHVNRVAAGDFIQGVMLGEIGLDGIP